MAFNLTKFKHKLRRAVGGAAPSLEDDVLSVQAAKALTEHYSPSILLPYLDFEDGYMLRDNGKEPQLCFGFYISPATIAGKDVEDQLETMISRAPDDTVIQFAMHSTPNIDFRLNLWAERRLKYCKTPLIEEMVKRRVKHFKDSAVGDSLLPKEALHPREMRCYVFVTTTYHKDPEHEAEIKQWKESIDDYRDSIEGSLSVMGLGPQRLGYFGALTLIRELCNPQMVPSDLEAKMPLEEVGPKFKDECFERQTRLRVESNGDLLFSDSEREKVVVPITVDQYPQQLRLYMTGELLGHITSGTDRIAPPFWMYTNIYKPNPDKARDSMTGRLALISKQCMSDSEWYKSMVPHIFLRRYETQQFLENTRGKLCATRIYTGINVISTPERATSDADYVSGLWRKAGFKASRESYISLPIWQNSLPWGYNYAIDDATAGIQRAQPVTSLNAATAAICQGDWAGNGPMLKKGQDGKPFAYANGLLLTSRRGQMACIDIFESPTNYNFAVIATSGAGKSFFANEIVSDIRSRGGVVRIIDAGGSYADLVRLMDGMEIRFDPKNPVSLNPYWGMSNQTQERDEDGGSELSEMVPLLKDVTCQMAFPVAAPTNEEYQLMEKALYAAHAKAGKEMGLKDIWDWFVSQSDYDDIYKRIAIQLEPFAVGRLAVWFNGEPQLDLSNPVTVLELDELNNDMDLRTVILTLLMAQTTRDMYLGDRSVPKLMLTDEAWDLFSDPKPAKVIETAFRRIRKYFGAAGFITQGFADTDMSAAAVAAYASSSWRFILKQTPESAEYGREHNKLGQDDGLLFDLIRSIRPGDGFSEVYVQHETGSGLFRFITDKYTYLTYSSKAQDILALKRLQEERGIGLAEALALYADGELER